VATIAQPRHRWAWAALALSVANIVITVAAMVFFTGPWLETPTYVAKLWPAALLALVLLFTSMSPGTHEGKKLHSLVIAVMAVATVPLLIWSGRFDGVLSYPSGWLIGLGVLLLITASALLVRSYWNLAVVILLAVSVSATFIAAQFLQNGRGNLGTYGQYPFRSAFVDFSYRDQMAAKIQTQRWLIDNTSRDDSILVWTNADRLTADIAGMQLWGDYNIVTLEPELSRDSTARLEELRPTVVAMYAPSREQITAFYDSLPPWSLPSELQCLSVPYLGVGTGEAITCLTRLTWVG